MATRMWPKASVPFQSLVSGLDSSPASSPGQRVYSVDRVDGPCRSTGRRCMVKVKMGQPVKMGEAAPAPPRPRIRSGRVEYIEEVYPGWVLV